MVYRIATERDYLRQSFSTGKPPRKLGVL